MRIAKIGEVAKQIRGVSYKINDVSHKPNDGMLPVLRATNIQGSLIVDKDFVFVPKKYIKDEQLLRYGDILIAASSGSISIVGKAAMIQNEMNASFGAFCKVLRPDVNIIYPKYFKHYFESPYYKTTISQLAEGININNLKSEHFNGLIIPLPPPETQKKIAAILDAADEYRHKTKTLIEKYDELAQSLFLEMFGDPVRNEKGWEIITIGDILTDIKYGTSAKASENGEYKYLRMNNITYKGAMDFSDFKYIDIHDNDFEKYSVRKGDVLFNRTNSKELVGKTGIIETDEKMIIAGYLIRLRVNNLANPYYLWGHLNSKWSKLTLKSMCKNIIGMANINAREVQNIKILKAPISVQNQFALYIQEIQAQKEMALKALEKSDELFNSLLQKAFKGELV